MSSQQRLCVWQEDKSLTPEWVTQFAKASDILLRGLDLVCGVCSFPPSIRMPEPDLARFLQILSGTCTAEDFSPEMSIHWDPVPIDLIENTGLRPGCPVSTDLSSNVIVSVKKTSIKLFLLYEHSPNAILDQFWQPTNLQTQAVSQSTVDSSRTVIQVAK